MSNSRTKNSILNTIYGICSYIIILLVTFVMRRIFADCLGQEYLGLNSLYTNIISMLSLTELGLSTAMLFFLYKPINEGDKPLIKTLMQFYKKLYRIIALLVLMIGLILTIFIDKIANAENIDTGPIRFYFLLFVLNSSASYLLAYKKSILYADQKARVISTASVICKMIMILLQIIVLILWKSYLAFVILYLFGSLSENIICSLYVDKKYSYVRKKDVIPLTKNDRKKIFDKVKPLFVQNLAAFAVMSTDNIIISTCINVATVGIYSNYILITQTLKTLFSQIFSAFTTSFGNLSVNEDAEKCREVYNKSVFMAFWIICVCSVCYISLIQPFIKLWMGDPYLFQIRIPILITLSFYFTSMNVPAISVQNALGLHQKDQWVMVAQGVFNLIVSLTLVFFIGVEGVVLGTVLSTIIFPLISKEHVICKYFFKSSSRSMYLRHLVYFIITIVISLLSYVIVNIWLPQFSIGWFVLKCIISFVFVNLCLVLLFFKTKNFKYYFNLVKNFVSRIFRKKKI